VSAASTQSAVQPSSQSGAQPKVQPEVLIHIDALECIRDGRALFSGLTLTLHSGELLALRGANGAGKSTLLRALAGLYPDYTGTLATAAFVYGGHKPGVSGHLSTAENLQFLLGLSNDVLARAAGPNNPAAGVRLKPLAESISAALVAVGLAGYEDVRCNALSAGQLRRVGLARLLLACEPVWLLDEPLTALDPAGAKLLGNFLDNHIAAGGGAVCATHQELPCAAHRSLLLTPTGVPELSNAE